MPTPAPLPSASHRRRRGRMARAAAALTAAAALVLTGCSSSATTGSSSPAAAGASDAFPVTVASALGSATIAAAPTRVAVWGWSAQDAVLALGVVPVAMPKMTYGGNADGVLPWDAEQITKLGGTTPLMLSGGDTGEPPIEEIAQAAPDVILAPYSGLTQEQYDTLSKIAPVVGYPDKVWSTTWQDQLTIVGKALGKTAEADALLKSTNDQVSALAAANPALAGTSFVYGASNSPDVFNVYTAGDPRVQLLVQLGMTVSDSVAKVDNGSSAGSFYFPVSFENVNQLTSDVLVAYFENQAAVDAFTADPLIAAMPAVKAGRFAPIVGESFVMATSAPSVLSIPWMLTQYVPVLAAAAAK
ncbi:MULTISPECIES: iron-siderophore ABC transporter substrate-binding protein [Subtercola]|uniref:Iron-siderophore ABC transporter substrate-binding protein n=1 Tax=Subtercola vilae TaxID=2056433 RepID=A0A4V4RFP6_9MICO|nr:MULTISPECIES: iron-siderophore ABC transporter substrate-binding protein [Subtercola]MEA9984107.1 iron-siderophore ABC transporter substrate-binding protein [Subtercola sp. RTI3]TIH38674.1 iron-siderophore ABC transporter substrate-binding protein [Subtercola vilae]